MKLFQNSAFASHHPTKSVYSPSAYPFSPLKSFIASPACTIDLQNPARLLHHSLPKYCSTQKPAVQHVQVRTIDSAFGTPELEDCTDKVIQQDYLTSIKASLQASKHPIYNYRAKSFRGRFLETRSKAGSLQVQIGPLIAKCKSVLVGRGATRFIPRSLSWDSHKQYELVVEPVYK